MCYGLVRQSMDHIISNSSTGHQVSVSALVRPTKSNFRFDANEKHVSPSVDGHRGDFIHSLHGLPVKGSESL